MSRWKFCARPEWGRLKVFNLMLVEVMQLDLGFRKIVLTAVDWEIIMFKVTMVEG